MDHRTVSMKVILSAATAVMVALAVAGVTLVTEHNVRALLQKETETRLVLEARNLALLSTDALLSQYPELTLYPLVREMLERQQDLSLAVVLDHDGLIQGHPDARMLGKPFGVADSFSQQAGHDDLQAGEEFLVNLEMVAVQVPVRHANGQLLGSVVVGQRRDHLTAVLAASRQQALVLAAMLAVSGGLIAVGLMRRLLRPIDAVRRGLERIGAGDLDTPINLRDHTELGLLASTVDEMAGQLKESRLESQAKEQEIVRTQHELINTLGIVVEGRSHETANHTVRVGHAAAMLATLAGLDDDQVELLRMAAPMHDVGKIAIPDAILNKPGKFDADDIRVMQTHTSVGFNILDHSERPILKAAAIVALEHHERWDGKGYPRGIAGDDIHVYGRIVSIVDVFDALVSDRIYRAAMPLSKALSIMREGRGTQFDPGLLDLFFANIESFQGLMESYADIDASIESVFTEVNREPEPVLQA